VPRKTRTPKYRTPTYGAATRLARIVHELPGRPYGWSHEAIMAELDISARTLARYQKMLREEFVDDQGRPLIEEVAQDERRLLRMAAHAHPVESTAYEVASFCFALEVFKFLEGTVLKQGVDGLWERFAKGLPARIKLGLPQFRKRFFAVPYAPKLYTECDQNLDVIVRCLIGQNRVRIQYNAIERAGKTHLFEPYTLAMYRSGLYLIGKSDRGSKVITLAVERIASAEKLPERFEYPKNYAPEKYTEGTFGIIMGPEETVELLVLNDQTLQFLAARQLHPTQQFRKRRDGKTVLTMTVRGTAELKNWLLGMAPWVKVLRPASLRDEVRGLLEQARQVYADER